MEEKEWKEWYENSETWIELGDICYKQDLCMFGLDSYINGIKYEEEKSVEIMKKISILYGRLCRFGIYINIFVIKIEHALSSIQNVLLINGDDVESIKIKENLLKAIEQQKND